MSRKGGKEALSAGAADAVPTSCSPADCEPPLLHALPVCRLPQRRDRVPSGAGYSFTEHGESRPRRRRG